MTIGDTLESIQKQFNLYDNATSKALGDTIIDGVNVNALQFEAGILDGPVINTRAGLHVYLNALVRHHSFPLSFAFPLISEARWTASGGRQHAD